ncbi:acyl-CoA dehydrogenase [Leptospira ellisii]|uniref:Acyl-CoA dehydrogenase n=1 Tax=Leptospira ellisii TaxID=2023197 RepID=A0A2N0BK47_9LEPT|nr:acyl-CoA dehydrogenase [Leptospira ellisii]MDV6235077.1 acyl-CoA dehydrogenase [Leptospira ellisii]PJZ93259.1 acyl-CoA dehydrogenase [Leptospira ellisii]PKA04377.1 acyl-CoA dehydrogenase [Leptospira ellisii]
MTLKEFLTSVPPEEYRTVFRNALPYLIREGYFDTVSGGSFETFHKKVYELGSYPKGIGIGIALMAQINVAGRVIRYGGKGFFNETETRSLPQREKTSALMRTIQSGIQSGTDIISMGVSETGWKGRISNITSRYTIENDSIVLDLNKSFLTNGANCNGFFIVAKSPDEFYDVIYLPLVVPGLERENFDLEYAKEATHCRLKGSGIILPSENLVFLNYEEFAPEIHLSEMLSASASFCGYVELILKTLLKQRRDEMDPRLAAKIIDIQQLLYSKILEISRMKDSDPDFRMESVHPYGYETALDLVYSWLTEAISGPELAQMFPDIGLFYSIHPGRMPVYQKNSLKKIRALRSL